MQLGERSHEHAASAKVYTYRGEYEIGAHEITWKATVNRGTEVERELSGTVPVSSPGVAAVAEQVVNDAIVKRIDSIETK
ncbi:hypothetical protein [Piscinibacter sp.]|uniref:hypothetical protein n=1 Tax=Piscinibacter sp. TaxID=1903157 RepID=UPI002C2C9843|nr:hypothetical protein [Albitalea sp.]HUG21316.1 hypothetical protein [Albitalea sp.]